MLIAIFMLIAAPGGALPTREAHMVDEVMDKPPETPEAQHPSSPPTVWPRFEPLQP
jgi:hypothetical protein